MLDVVLIFGVYPFPRMEVAGAGLATALDLAAGTAYYLLRAAPRTGLRRRFGAMRLWQVSRAEPEDAEAWGWETVRLAVYFFTVAGALVAVAPGPVLRVFTDDAQVIEAGKLALRMVGLSQCAYAAGMVLSNVLISAGSARFVMVVNVGFVFALVLPAVYVACLVLDAGGVALAWGIMGAGRLAMAAAMAVRFKQGRWKTSTL